MTRLRLGVPVWLADDSAAVQPGAPFLHSHISADVVIVGGGLTGAAIAYQCASHGLDVVLLEAGRFGSGSTSANTGLLVYEPDEPLQSLGARHGLDAALRVWRRSRDAAAALIATLRRLHVECGLARRTSIYFARSSTGVRPLACEQRLRRRHGLGGRWLDAGELAALGVRGAGGIETTGHAQLDPYRACLGLLGAAAHAGARLHGGSRAVRIDTVPRGVRVHTEHGSVRAGHVVVATGYATPEFRPLAGGFKLSHTYAMSTPPLPAAVRARIGLPDVLLWSAGRPYHYARWGPGNRLIVGGADRPLVPESRRALAFVEGRRRLAREVRAICPGLRGVPFELAWEGLFAETPDGLPYLGPNPRYPRHLFALGYGGNGMTSAWLAARMLTRCLIGTPDPDLELFSFDRFGRAESP